LLCIGATKEEAMQTTPGLSPTAAKNVAPDRSVAATLERIEARLDRLEELATKIDRVGEELPKAVATLTDTADELIGRIQASGVDLDERARILLRVAERLTAPEALEAIEALLSQLGSVRAVLESGVLAPQAVDVVARAAGALSQASDAPPVGAWGAMRALGDPEVQRALGFLLGVAKGFGAQLAEPPLLAASNQTSGRDSR
jgi:uncharacterized protein YjgD (DUF1641 family)